MKFVDKICSFFGRSLDIQKTGFNDLPDLVFLEIFKYISMDEIKHCRRVSTLWNNFFLQSYHFNVSLTKENWETVTQFNGCKIMLNICELEKGNMPLSYNQLDYSQHGFFQNVKNLETQRISPKTLYNILYFTQNLENLCFYHSTYKSSSSQIKITEQDWEWAENFELQENEREGWLPRLKTFKIVFQLKILEPLYKQFLQKILDPCSIATFGILASIEDGITIFSPKSFDYNNTIQITNPDSFVRRFIDNHKCTLKFLTIFTQRSEIINFNVEYHRMQQRLKIQSIKTENLFPVNTVNDVGILNVVSNQNSIATLEIGQHTSETPHFNYQNYLLLNIFPNNSNTLTKLDLYTHVVNPATERLIWHGFSFSKLSSLRSLCLRSNALATNYHGVLDQIQLLPPYLNELTTSLCITFDFSCSPLDPNRLKNIFPNLEKLKMEAVPWLSFQGNLVSSITTELLEFFTKFKSLDATNCIFDT